MTTIMLMLPYSLFIPFPSATHSVDVRVGKSAKRRNKAEIENY